MFHTLLFLTDLTQAQLPSLDQLQRLTEAERHRASGLQAVRQKQFVSGRLLLRHAIEQLTGSPLNGLQERVGLAPLLTDPGSRGLRFSISHSRNLVAVALAKPDMADAQPEMELGLDVEYEKPVRRFSAAKFFCSEAELDALEQSVREVTKTTLYFQLWTQKEAAYKAVNERDPSVTLKHFCSQEAPLDTQAPARLRIASVIIDGRYHIALYRSRVSTAQIEDIREAAIKTIWVLPIGDDFQACAGPEPDWSGFGLRWSGLSSSWMTIATDPQREAKTTLSLCDWARQLVSQG